MVEETNKHFGLALTSLILGGVSLLSFMLYGLSAIPALIGAIFGLICLIKGQKQDRKSTRLNSSHDRQSRMPSSA